MEEEKQGTGAEITPETEPEKEISLDELLASNKKYQSEYDKKVAQAMNTRLDNERKKWEEEQKNKLEEAEKLAKMDADEKKNYELEQWKTRAEKAEKQNSINELKSETIKQATAKGIPLDFITFNFEYETAETIKSKLEILEKAVKSEREKVINEYSGEPAPKTGERVIQKDISQMSYTELAEYLNKHPEINL